MKFIPLTNHILVEGTPNALAGPIHLPDSVQDSVPTTGTVLAVGPWVSEKSDIKVGDVVLLPQLGGRRLRHESMPRSVFLLLFEDQDLEVKIEA